MQPQVSLLTHLLNNTALDYHASQIWQSYTHVDISLPIRSCCARSSYCKVLDQWTDIHGKLSDFGTAL